MVVRVGRRPRAAEGERGETLIELLVGVLLMGVAFAAIFQAFLTVTAASQLNRQKTEVGLYLQHWAERTLTPIGPAGTGSHYQECGVGAPDVAKPTPVPTGWSATYTVEYLKATGYRPKPSEVDPATFTNQAGCTYYGRPDGSLGDGGLQKITLTVTSEPGRFQVTESLVIYKRDPWCAPVDDDGDPNTDPIKADKGPC